MPLLREVGQQGIDAIFEVEHIFLTQEREYLGEAPIRTSSLENAIEELDATMEMLVMVRDISDYDVIDRGFSLGKNRVKELPHDQAHQFFESHRTRLSNIERASLDEYAREILAVREANLEAAKQLYMDLQRKALAVNSPDAVRESKPSYAILPKAA